MATEHQARQPRVRHIEDGTLGRIVWANAVAVKIQWDDGEKVTLKAAPSWVVKGLTAVVDEEETCRGASDRARRLAAGRSVEPAGGPSGQAARLPSNATIR